MGAKSACGVWLHSTEYVGSPLDSMAPLLLCGERRRNESAKQKHCNYITVLTSYQWPRLVRPTGKQRQQWPTPDRRPGALVIISYSIKFLSGAIFSGAQNWWAPTSAHGNVTHQSLTIDTWREGSDSSEYALSTHKHMAGRLRLKRVRSLHP